MLIKAAAWRALHESVLDALAWQALRDALARARPPVQPVASGAKPRLRPREAGFGDGGRRRRLLHKPATSLSVEQLSLGGPGSSTLACERFARKRGLEAELQSPYIFLADLAPIDSGLSDHHGDGDLQARNDQRGLRSRINIVPNRPILPCQIERHFELLSLIGSGGGDDTPNSGARWPQRPQHPLFPALCGFDTLTRQVAGTPP